jgi:predicted N-acetyltransferase YhbS
MNNDIKIRKAIPDDAEQISLLIKDSMGYENPPELVRSNIERLKDNPDHLILVADKDGEIVGLSHGMSYDSIYYMPLKNLMSMAVKSAYQRQDIGRTLLSEIEKWAKESGCAGVRIVSGMERKGAHLFYQACGYKLNKTQVNLIKEF